MAVTDRHYQLSNSFFNNRIYMYETSRKFETFPTKFFWQSGQKTYASQPLTMSWEEQWKFFLGNNSKFLEHSYVLWNNRHILTFNTSIQLLMLDHFTVLIKAMNNSYQEDIMTPCSYKMSLTVASSFLTSRSSWAQIAMTSSKTSLCVALSPYSGSRWLTSTARTTFMNGKLFPIGN